MHSQLHSEICTRLGTAERSGSPCCVCVNVCVCVCVCVSMCECVIGDVFMRVGVYKMGQLFVRCGGACWRGMCKCVKGRLPLHVAANLDQVTLGDAGQQGQEKE